MARALFQIHKICSCSFFLRVEEHHLPSGSDAGCSGTKPASSIVIQNRQTVASQGARCMGYSEWRGLRFVRWRRTRNSTMERDPICTWKRPTSGRRQLSLAKDVPNKPIPTGLVMALEMKTWSMDALLEYSALHL